MSNLGEELANRGSKLCMQICVNNVTDDYSRDKKLTRLSRKHLLDKAIGLGEIEWISPLSSDSFREYELRDIQGAYSVALGIKKMDWSFWAQSRQPQWDAIGITPDNSLVLVEAKANCKEVSSEWSAKSEESRRKIKSAIYNTLGENDKWLTKYYQMANRLVFLDKLSEFYGDTRKVYCVFLYFANDVTLNATSRKPASEQEWKSFLDCVHKEVHTPERLQGKVKEIILDIWKDTGIDKEDNNG